MSWFDDNLPAAGTGGFAYNVSKDVSPTGQLFQQPGGGWSSQPPAPTGNTATAPAASPSAGGNDLGGPAAFGNDYQKWFMALVQAHGGAYNQNTLNDLMPILSKHGVQLTPPNAAGDQTKINIPGQGWVRVGFGEGHPVWIPQGSGGGGSGAPGGTGQAVNPEGGNYSNIAPYAGPDALTEQNDPGYKARMQLGEEAVQESAAAKGGLLSGGTLKALEQYAQTYGSNEFNNVFNRGQTAYQNRYGQYQDWQNWNQQAQNRAQNAAAAAGKPPAS